MEHVQRSRGAPLDPWRVNPHAQLPGFHGASVFHGSTPQRCPVRVFIPRALLVPMLIRFRLSRSPSFSDHRDCSASPSVLTLPIRSGAAFRRTRGDEMAPVGKKPSHAGKAVVAGGISGAVEICCTYPVSRLTCDPITAPPTPSVPPLTVRTRSLHRLSSPRQCSSCPPRMCLPWRS